MRELVYKPTHHENETKIFDVSHQNKLFKCSLCESKGVIKNEYRNRK